MFGSLGGSEVIVLFVLALLLFGPRRLPEIGRTIGRAVGEFRKATQDFRMNLEREVEIEKVKDAARSIETSVGSTLPRGSILDPVPEPESPSTRESVDPSAEPHDQSRADA